MQVFTGKSVFEGIAIGNIVLINNNKQIAKEKISDIDTELHKFDTAKIKAKEELEQLYNKTIQAAGEEVASIFRTHKLIIDDIEFDNKVRCIVKEEKVNIEYAVLQTGKMLVAEIKKIKDAYVSERAADIIDITNRILNILLGIPCKEISYSPNSIIIAEDLTPSQTTMLDKSKVVSFVTSKGSTNSHTAVLAGIMGIPAIVSADIDICKIANTKNNLEGALAIVDGNEGKIYVNPTEEILALKKVLLQKQIDNKEKLNKLIGKQTIAQSGQKISLFANISGLEDMKSVLENDAEGIGLFRSEFVYLERENFPTEQEQFEIYRQAAQEMPDKPVIIRTLDIGADKRCDYFNLEKENNPALGYRAIRICLTNTEIFKIQLRALFRAAYFGNIMVMYPMITSSWEITKIKEIVDEVKEELNKENVKYRIPKQGIMIETPAAALCSDELAKMADFFSIGTNDLTQYTLAADRENNRLDKFYNSHHPAVLKLIKLVVENAHKESIKVGICGELAGDFSLTEQFIKMGVDELSVAPSKILGLRKKVLKIKC